LAKRRNPFQQRATTASIPPSTGGWNARDALASMDPADAVVMDNFTPGATDVSVRNGYETFCTGLGVSVETLMEYNPPDATATKLFAVAGSTLYDVTTGTASSQLTGLTNARWQHTMMATAGGNFLMACNGADGVRYYNGSWNTSTITGVSAALLVNVCNHQNRLWFVEKDSLRAWYLAGASIQGAATEFNIGPLCRAGGHLVAMGTITRDGGAGMDDNLVFITSKGEVAIYSGTDPNDADLWQLQGIFKIAEPIGRRCLVRIGADLGVLTSGGLVALSSVVPISPSGQSQAAASSKISRAFEDAYRSAGSVFGWQPVEYAKEGLVIVNVPVIAGRTQYQFVMNSSTGAWARWKAIDVNCWSSFGDGMYGGANDGKVIRLTDEYDDDGADIEALLIPAFNRFGSSGRKHFKEARVLAFGPSDYYPGLAAAVDYNTSNISYSYPTSPRYTLGAWGLGRWGQALWGTGSSLAYLSGPLWDITAWDEAEWGAETVPLSSWQTVNGVGVAGTVAISLSLSEPYTVNGIDIVFERGGLL